MYSALKLPVDGRGIPPDSFLDQLLVWAKNESPEVFAPNSVPVDIFTAIKPFLATPMGRDPSGTPVFQWDSLLHRRAALCEAMRVHAGRESSWRFDCGVDRSNPSSLKDPRREETGIFQVSFDSLNLGHGSLRGFAKANGIDGGPRIFIKAMKEDHQLAFAYYARLVRISIAWAGPLIRHSGDCIYTSISRKAVAEFMRRLAA